MLLRKKKILIICRRNLKSWRQRCRKYLIEAPHDLSLCKIVFVFALYDACSRNELMKWILNDIENHGKYLLVTLIVRETKTHTSSSFVIPDVRSSYGDYAIYRKYVGLRPSNVGTRRFLWGIEKESVSRSQLLLFGTIGTLRKMWVYSLD